MTFYKNCLGGELSLVKTGDTPMKAQFPPEKHHLIINAQLKSGAIEISATDWHSDIREPKQGNMMNIFIIGEAYDELRSVFDKLADGASKDFFVDLKDMPFGTFGQLTDRFGVNWIFKGDKKQ